MWRSPKAATRSKRPKAGTFLALNLETAIWVLGSRQEVGLYRSTDGHKLLDRAFWRGWLTGYLSGGGPLSEEERASLEAEMGEWVALSPALSPALSHSP